jgi:predicted GH43/DUF377 family glycosyl hydrolase
MIQRFDCNPLITPADVKPSSENMEVLCAFNAGATTYKGDPLLLVRVAERPKPREGFVATAFMNEDTGVVEPLYVSLDDPELDFTDPRVFTWKGKLYLTSISHLRVATTEDGESFTIADAPALFPENAYEIYGVEDPRIVFIDGWYYVNYSAISLRGVCTALCRTKDFSSFERLGIMFGPDNKDIALFPEKINGRYYTFHRPSMKQIGTPSMWIASSDNLRDWGRHENVIEPRPGKWDSERVGCGAQPIKTEKGWLQIYHASDEHVRYCSGAVLLDLEEPWKVIARSEEPLLFPEMPYECEGLVPNIVFHNGLVENADGTLTLFYGGADTVTCAATVSIADILSSLED